MSYVHSFSFYCEQNEIYYNVKIEKPSLYRMVLRYMNPGPDDEIAHIAIIPESHIDPQQSFQVLLKPTDGKPAFTTVAGPTNSIPSPLVMDPGNWIVVIKYKGPQTLLLVSFVVSEKYPFLFFSLDPFLKNILIFIL